MADTFSFYMRLFCSAGQPKTGDFKLESQFCFACFIIWYYVPGARGKIYGLTRITVKLRISVLAEDNSGICSISLRKIEPTALALALLTVCNMTYICMVFHWKLTTCTATEYIYLRIDNQNQNQISMFLWFMPCPEVLTICLFGLFIMEVVKWQIKKMCG